MSFFTILETILIGPLKLVFEIIFSVSNRFIGHPGLAIIMLSLVMNILILPLYRRADAMQDEAKEIEAKLHKGVAHIKKTFSGDERMMILQTYYRQNNYTPVSALNGSVSLLLEIPFFMAAYQFLSHLDILAGVSLGPITDLSLPDGLLVIGGVTINLLPIIMTLVNVISSALYLKGSPLKTKIQLYGMAFFFLVFLYNSPSCLVFYWTLNNVFSLVKTIFYKLKNPQKILVCLTTVIGIGFGVLGLFLYDTDSLTRKLFLVGIGALLQLPLIMSIAKGKITLSPRKYCPNRRNFILGGVFLTILVGALIPSTFIAASPQEFVDLNCFYHPSWYIAHTLCLAIGTFLVWMGVFYWLANDKWKVLFEKLVWILCGGMLVNYMFFGTNLGILNSNLQYENGLVFSWAEQIINLLIWGIVAVVICLVVRRKQHLAVMALSIMFVALGGMSIWNGIVINESIEKLSLQDNAQEDTFPEIQLSKTGKNVVVLMLDRAMGGYVPYIFDEKPELEEQFSGFTYYANTISFGGFTNFGTPALLGGYEYTPVEMNKRSSETLVSKHNEAHKVLPVLFLENDYNVTVCDPVYTNYQWIADLSVFDEYPEINTYVTKGKFENTEQKISVIESNQRNFFCFSLMKSIPLCLQPAIYNGGAYNQVDSHVASTQTIEGTSKARGINTAFEKTFYALDNLAEMTKCTDNDENTFLFMTNDTTHEPALLQTPDYIPDHNVDNTDYDANHTDRFQVDGQSLVVDDAWQMSHYHINMAAFIKLGEWFDYLRENNLYDNTRIILVADHGQPVESIERLNIEPGGGDIVDVEHYFPLLMVKDFESEGFKISYEFMTNADVPTLATENLIANPKNPFTGQMISSAEKNAHEQYVIKSDDWDVSVNNGNTFLPAEWMSIKDDIWNEDNWTHYGWKSVLTEHQAPKK